MTDTTITLGFPDEANAEAANSALGGNSSTSSGDETQDIKVVVADINKAGGIAGRTVIPAVHTYDDTSAQPMDTQEQAACTDWTVDQKVYGVVAGDPINSLRSCLGQAKTPDVSWDLTDADDDTYRQYPLWVEPADADLDRTAAVTVEGLQSQNYFANPSNLTKTKIGLFRIDSPEMAHASNAVLKPALAKLGLSVSDEFALTFPQSTDQYAAAISSAESAALKFKADGITHVLFLSFNQAPVEFFMLGASNQAYYPRYGLNSGNGAQALIDGGVPQAEFANAVIVGWLPEYDVPLASAPAPNALKAHCMAIFNAAGDDATGGNSLATELGYCEAAYFYRAVLGTAHVPIGPDSFTQGLAKVGNAFTPAQTFTATINPPRNDGASSWYGGSYSAGCNCFSYSGGPHSF